MQVLPPEKQEGRGYTFAAYVTPGVVTPGVQILNGSQIANYVVIVSRPLGSGGSKLGAEYPRRPPALLERASGVLLLQHLAKGPAPFDPRLPRGGNVRAFTPTPPDEMSRAHD